MGRLYAVNFHGGKGFKKHCSPIFGIYSGYKRTEKGTWPFEKVNKKVARTFLLTAFEHFGYKKRVTS
jgi:hypothetical protein